MIIKSDNGYFLSSWHPPRFHRHFSEPLGRNLDERETLPPCPQSSPLSGPPGEKSMSLEMLGKDLSHLFPSKVSISRRYLPAWLPPITLSLPSSTIMLWLCRPTSRPGRLTQWPELTS